MIRHILKIMWVGVAHQPVVLVLVVMIIRVVLVVLKLDLEILP